MAAAWLSSTLNGDQRVGIPWQTIGAFVRISTHPRIWPRPLRPEEATAYIKGWFASELVWIPQASERTTGIFTDLITGYGITGNLVTDAQLAALAIEHGLELFSADTDFARFKELRWRNPLA